LLGLELLLKVLLFCSRHDTHSSRVRKRFFPAHSVIRISTPASASAAFLLCQRDILSKRWVLILVSTNVPFVIIVYLLVVSPYGGRVTVNL